MRGAPAKSSIEMQTRNNFACLGENFGFRFMLFLYPLFSLPWENPVIRVGRVVGMSGAKYGT